jgi:1,4-alpha-glucan branching enzyme
MLYAYDENFILVLSHDEVVHGKGSLINKMPGDRWQKFANLRLFLSWMWTHPGKKLLFMGGEFGQWTEWSHERSLDWHVFLGAEHAGLQKLVQPLNHLYQNQPALHELCHQPGGFHWLDADDADGSLFAFYRSSSCGQRLTILANATPVVRGGYRVGVPDAGNYQVMLNSDATEFGGSGAGASGVISSEAVPWQHQTHSLLVDVPPLGILILGAG